MERFAQRVKRVETWLRDRSWVIWGLRVAVLWPVCLLWVMPIWQPLKTGVQKEVSYNPDLQLQKKLSTAMGHKADELLAQAKKSGLNYGPAHYFRDLRSLESMAWKGHFDTAVANGQLSEMQELMRKNCKPDSPGMWSGREAMQKWFNDPRRFVQSQISRERSRYSTMQGMSDEDIAAEKKRFKAIPWDQKMAWLWGVWLRGLIPMFFLHLLRMVERKGILETFLADKVGFLSSISNWPVYTFVYPSNVLREIQVEVELRRIEGLFRRLNPVERFTIHRVADASDYKEELQLLRKVHRLEYQRGLVVALLATLVLMLLPKLSEAKPSKAGADPQGVAMAMTRAGPIVQVDLGAGDLPVPRVAADCALPDLAEVQTLGLAPLAIRLVRPPRQEVMKRIDHVPLVHLADLCRFFDRVISRRTKDAIHVASGCAVRSVAGHLGYSGVGG